MGIEQAKIVKTWKHDNQKPGPIEEYVISALARQRYFTQCIPLHKAALRGDWEAAQKLLKDSTLVKTHITKGGETALHIAAVQGHTNFVANLLDKMVKFDVEIQNEKGCTALCFAAAAGNLEIAKLMVKMNRNLPTIGGKNGVTPLYMAALQGHKEMAEYLYSLSDFQSWTIEDQIELLTTSIQSGLYDLAVSIVNQYKMLAVAEDSCGETPLQILASKPLTICGARQRGFWGNIVGTILSFMELTGRNTSAPCDAYTLFDCLWHCVICQEDLESQQFSGKLSKLLFVAAELGNDDFLVELIRRYPDFLYQVNDSKHSIFHIAVSHRHVEVFNLMHELGGIKDLIASYIDKDGNNILHLAANLAPQNQLNRIPGAALQMQREVLWYKEVEKIVQPSYRNMKNSTGQTPYDLFLAEHKSLMKEGEKQMKQITKSCMLVTVLIATVVFTANFTVAGSYNNIAAPILQDPKLFMVFPISEAIAFLASLTSMLVFLSALTSHCSDNELLRSLPFWLMVEIMALFISVVVMIVAISTCLLFYAHGTTPINIVLVFSVGVPIAFLILKYPLLVTVVRCTYGSKWLFRSSNRLFL